MNSNPSMAQVEQAILNRIDTGKHSVWGASDFADLAKRSVVDLALSQLNSSNRIKRVVRGLYYKPRTNTLTGRPTAPDTAGVVDAITRRGAVRYIVDGMTAANDLGWETAVPANYLAYTDARLQPVTLGNLEIRFKPVTVTKLTWAGNPAMRVVQALYYFQDKLDRERDFLSDKLDRLLADPDHGDAIADGLRTGFPTLPAWMQDFLRPHLYLARQDDSEMEETPSGAKP